MGERNSNGRKRKRALKKGGTVIIDARCLPTIAQWQATDELDASGNRIFRRRKE